MTTERVEELATDFVFRLMGRPLRLLGVHRDSERKDEWNAVFERTTKDGYLMDGPLVVVVNMRTEDTHLLT